MAHEEIGGPVKPDRRHGFEVHVQQFAEGAALAQPAPCREFAARGCHPADQEAGDRVALATVEEAIGRRQIKITEIMDILWTIQEIVFDLMLPWRTELPEDVEPDGPISGAPDWRRWTAVA